MVRKDRNKTKKSISYHTALWLSMEADPVDLGQPAERKLNYIFFPTYLLSSNNLQLKKLCFNQYTVASI